jgi:hypothetical protein
MYGIEEESDPLWPPRIGGVAEALRLGGISGTGREEKPKVYAILMTRNARAAPGGNKPQSGPLRYQSDNQQTVHLY